MHSQRKIILVCFVIVICCTSCTFIWNNKIYKENPLADSRRSRRSFYEDYDDLCFEEIAVNNEGGSISSPGFPDTYPSDSNCSWLLIAPAGRKINLLLNELVIEESADCAYDFVEIFDGSVTSDPSFGRFCGRREEQLFVSSSSEVLVVFVSDSAYEEPGFKIDFSLVSENLCNKTVVQPEGTITSPNYPNHYPDDVDCWTVIKALEPDSKIFVQFSTIDLEPTDGCEFDYVEISDGFSQDYPRIGRYCDTYSREYLPIISSGNSLLIHFHADHLVSGRGFSLTYSVITGFAPQKNTEVGDCVWIMEELSGTLTSPNYPNSYFNNQECIFKLEAPPGHQIRLTFEDIVMEDDPECNFDHVDIYDGNATNSHLLGKFCGGTAPGTSVTSRSNSMYVKFLSDDQTVFNGFKAKYAVVNEIHEGVATKEDSDRCVDAQCESLSSPPKGVVVTSKPHNITLSAGDSHAFTCGATDSNVVVMWMKDLSFLTEGELSLPGLEVLPNQTLQITDMSWKLEGQYTCVLVSSEGSEAVIAWVMLDEQDKQEECDLRFEYTPQDTVVEENSFTFLRCAAPNADILWEKDGELIEIIETTQIKSLLPGLLLINRATKKDSGSYTCIATNKQLGCSVRIEANVLVTSQLTEVCGQPIINEPNTDKPHLNKGKIVGGHAAAKGSSPWQVMLWEQKASLFCGGSLVAAEWVVTAAHCIAFFKAQQHHELYWPNLFIKFGKTDKEREESHERIVGVRDIIMHPHYKKETFESDIALIRLKSKVKFSPYIMPICLGNERFLNSHVYERRVWGTVTGWGKLTEASLHPRFLMEIRLPVIETKICNDSTTYAMTKNMFCAGYAQEVLGDACQGDSGGPFAVKENNRWYLAGIVSWGEGCGRRGKYGFYTKVGNFYSWIKDHIQNQILF